MFVLLRISIERINISIIHLALSNKAVGVNNEIFRNSLDGEEKKKSAPKHSHFIIAVHLFARPAIIHKISK